jgi:hypothetical protein
LGGISYRGKTASSHSCGRSPRATQVPTLAGPGSSISPPLLSPPDPLARRWSHGAAQLAVVLLGSPGAQSDGNRRRGGAALWQRSSRRRRGDDQRLGPGLGQAGLIWARRAPIWVRRASIWACQILTLASGPRWGCAGELSPGCRSGSGFALPLESSVQEGHGSHVFCRADAS